MMLVEIFSKNFPLLINILSSWNLESHIEILFSLLYIYIYIYSFRYIKHNLARNYHAQKMQSFTLFFFFFFFFSFCCLNSRRCEKYEFYPIGNNIRNNNVTNSYIFRTVTLFNFTRKTSYVKKKNKRRWFLSGIMGLATP